MKLSFWILACFKIHLVIYTGPIALTNGSCSTIFDISSEHCKRRIDRWPSCYVKLATNWCAINDRIPTYDLYYTTDPAWTHLSTLNDSGKSLWELRCLLLKGIFILGFSIMQSLTIYLVNSLAMHPEL